MFVRLTQMTTLIAVVFLSTALLAEETPVPAPPDPAETPASATEGADNGQNEPKQAPKGPLQQRMEIIDVPVSAKIELGSGFDNPSSFWDGKPLRPIIYAPQSNGAAKIGWTDTDGKIHITPVDENSRRSDDDTIIHYGLLRDLVAHEDGSAVLVLQDGGMFLIRIQQGKPIFRLRLISNWSQDIHMGSLAWNGQRYAAYFGISGGGHEGDALRFVSPDGQLLDGGWDWGVSHSIDMRIVALGQRFMPLALSDAYPGTGIYFNHNQMRVSYTWGDHSGATGARIGGMVALGDKMFVAFSSKEGGRSHWTAALADFAQDAPHNQSVHKYLQDASVDQLNVKIARYGDDQLLVSWLEQGSWRRKFQRYDIHGKPIGQTEVLQVRAPARADMRNNSSGDVLWAHNWGKNRQVLKVVRIRHVKDE